MWKIDDFRPIYQKFLESCKTVRKFCSDEGIEECRSYHWQAKARKLRERRRADAAKRHSENKPSRKVLPDNLERKPVHCLSLAHFISNNETKFL